MTQSIRILLFFLFLIVVSSCGDEVEDLTTTEGRGGRCSQEFIVDYNAMVSALRQFARPGDGGEKAAGFLKACDTFIQRHGNQTCFDVLPDGRKRYSETKGMLRACAHFRRKSERKY